MIPDYQSVMLPLMRYIEDGNEHRIGDVIEPLGDKLGLTESEMNELLPSGRQTIFANRVHWAKTYMAQAKLLEIHASRSLSYYRTWTAGFGGEPQPH